MAESAYYQALSTLRRELETARAEYERELHDIRAGKRDWIELRPKVEAFQRARDVYYAFLLQGSGAPWGSSGQKEKRPAIVLRQVNKSNRVGDKASREPQIKER
jgi:hypothetical protein